MSEAGAAAHPTRPGRGGRAADVVLALLLGAFAAIGVREVERTLGPGLTELENINLWYQSDTPRIHLNIVVRASDQYRSSVHPVFALASTAPVRVLTRLTGMTADAAQERVLWAEAFAWMATLFALLRSVGVRRPDAVVFALAGAASASALLWLPVAETFALGSITLMVALIVAARAARGRVGDAGLVATAALTLTMTVTNFMTGALLALAQRPPRRALHLLVLAFAAVTGVWAVQKALLPTSQYFLAARSETRYMFAPDAGRARESVIGFFAHTLVMPCPTPAGEDGALTVQRASADPGTLPGRVALGAWFALLALAIPGIVRAKPGRTFLVVLLGTLAGQFALHLLYGEEILLYSLHWLPCFVVLAAFSTFGRGRFAAVALALVFLAGALAQDARVLQTSREAVLARTTARGIVRREMTLRPGDPWPRGTGHVVLGLPASPDSLKAYAEPGGSFSPAVRSFGLSVWVLGPGGEPVSTGDDTPLARVRQRFEPGAPGLPPVLHEETPDYELAWWLEAPGRWRGSLRALRGPLALVLRGVGPAAGPVTRLAREGARLRVGGRWTIAAEGGAAAGWTLVSEHDRQWRTRATGPDSLADPAGWAAARLRVEPGRTVELRIADAVTAPAEPYPVGGARCEGGDEAFRDCLAAQFAHIQMGITDDGLRPGDPLEYGFAWARDEAFGIVALARGGRPAEAARLAEDFIAHDFFGGFGSEADSPGLGIWALAEVALTRPDAGFEARIAPAVERKARLIERMLTVPDTLFAPVEGPILPETRRDWRALLVSMPARDGLIDGRMDRHEPTLYVNAVSYLGLRDAATLAARRGEPAAAVRWNALADTLRAAWVRRFGGRGDDNDRTWNAALWPARVADSRRGEYRAGLERRWRVQRDARGAFRTAPAYSYFAIGEVHQWLELGEAERVWTSMRDLWTRQSSPGLYTWWEGVGEEHSSGAWRRVRGWTDPPTATPHYWSAAEMALLQLDMLAGEADDAAGSVVIGPGVPREWLARPFAVRDLALRGGGLDWAWDGRRVTVTFAGRARPVVLGGAFPAGALVATTAR